MLVTTGAASGKNEYDKCGFACTLEYSPVCANDPKGKTLEFGNECFFRVHVCKYPEPRKYFEFT